MGSRKFNFNGNTVSCARIARNSCGPDEYAVTIEHGGEETVITTFAGLFECPESVCARIYSEWDKNRN